MPLFARSVLFFFVAVLSPLAMNYSRQAFQAMA